MKYSFYILVIFSFCSCHEATEQVLHKVESNITVSIDFFPSQINAGEAISIKGTSNTSIGELLLELHHTLYSKNYVVKISNGLFEIEIPAIDNQIAGEVIANLVYQEQVIEKGKYFIAPIGAIDKMQNFNGPKSLFAGNEDASMNVSIPHDKYDNPLLPPTKVNYNKSFEGEILSEESKPIEHLIAYQITSSKPTKGKYLIGSKSDEGFSQEQELIIGPAMPQEFNIELLSFHPFADARQFLKFKTTVLKDQFDNIIADGTLIIFTIMENDSVVGIYQAFTIGGIANVYIENPSNETNWKVQASLHDQIRSNIVLLNFEQNIKDFDLSWNPDTQTLSIGPVIGILGQMVPDGTEAKISYDASSLEDYIYLENGKYNYQLGFDWKQHKPDVLKVLIGGYEKTIQIE